MKEKKNNWMSEEKFKCEWCDYKSRYSINLIQHERKCTNKKWDVKNE